MSEFFHKKSLGQNFLNNKELLEKISKFRTLSNEIVIEIGPGKGALTEFLLREKPEKLILIEKDKKLKPYLEKIKKKILKDLILFLGTHLN